MSSRSGCGEPARLIQRLMAHALERGATLDKVGTVSWDVSGGCQAPRFVNRFGRPFGREVDVYDTTHYNAYEPRTIMAEPRRWYRVNLNLTVKCGKCETCLRTRAREWAMRGWSEIRASHRTWFGTLTLSPEAHMRFLSLARVREGKQGVDLEALDAGEQFRMIERQMYREVSLMNKRLRKAGHHFRFMYVCEAHKSGLPHYHCLVHEVGEPIRHKVLVAAWAFGFTTWKLVDKERNVAWYVCKYLSKSALVAVRASVRYGREPLTAFADSGVLSELNSDKTLFTPRETLFSYTRDKSDSLTINKATRAVGERGGEGGPEAPPLLIVSGLNERNVRVSDLPCSGLQDASRKSEGGAGLSEAVAGLASGSGQSVTMDCPARSTDYAHDTEPPF